MEVASLRDSSKHDTRSEEGLGSQVARQTMFRQTLIVKLVVGVVFIFFFRFFSFFLEE